MRKLFSILFFLILFFAFSNTYAADRWQWITSTDNTTYSYDTTSIKRSYDNNYLVWIRMDYTNEEGEREMKDFHFSEPVSYSLARFEFDYKHDRERIVSIYVYSKARKAILNYTYPCDNWQTIAPDSISESLYTVTYNAFKKIQKNLD